jgi:hypothetical protein
MQPQPQKHVVALLSVIVTTNETMHIITPELCNSRILAPGKSVSDMLHALGLHVLQGVRWDIWWTRYQGPYGRQLL